MDDNRASVNLLESFEGVHSDAEASDVPEGKLWRCLNAMSLRGGELVTRGGLVELELDTLE